MTSLAHPLSTESASKLALFFFVSSLFDKGPWEWRTLGSLPKVSRGFFAFRLFCHLLPAVVVCF